MTAELTEAEALGIRKMLSNKAEEIIDLVPEGAQLLRELADKFRETPNPDDF